MMKITELFDYENKLNTCIDEYSMSMSGINGNSRSPTSYYTDHVTLELHTNPALTLWPLHVFDVGGLQIKENIRWKDPSSTQ